MNSRVETMIKNTPPARQDSVLPDFVIVGAARAGTTALAAALQRHPQICFSKIKETNYFTPPDFGLEGPGDQQFIFSEAQVREAVHLDEISADAALVRSRASYEKLFGHCSAQRLRGEASPGYFYYHAHAAAALAAANPQCRIVIVLRDRVQRTLSQYKVMVSWKREFLPLKDALHAEAKRKLLNWEYAWQYSGLSLYAPALASFFAVFPPQQCLILRFEEFVRQPDAALAQLAAFLSIAPEGLVLTKENDSLARISAFRLQLNRRISTARSDIERRVLCRAGGMLTRLEKVGLVPLMPLDERSFSPAMLANFKQDEMQANELLARYRWNDGQSVGSPKQNAREKKCTTG